MKIKKPLGLLVYLGIVFMLFSAGTYYFPTVNQLKKSLTHAPVITPQVKSNSSLVRVIRVIDGDTIEIEGNIKLRYIGIDTPETKHPIKGVQCFGKEASNKNKELVEGKMIRMEKDVSETDKYGRLLRYIWLVEPHATKSSELFVNDFLVRQGYAHASTFPPDVKYSNQFVSAQKEARENNRGLWNMCQ